MYYIFSMFTQLPQRPYDIGLFNQGAQQYEHTSNNSNLYAIVAIQLYATKPEV